MRSAAAIDKLNDSNRVSIKEAYKALKIQELHLVHGERLRLHEEREALREERAREREELAAQRELEARVRATEEEEARRRDALERARAELVTAADAEREAMRMRIEGLEAALAEAASERERALSMAQQTRAGHVYVISNIGSFGEDVFKIGMTRRLEPVERVQELGDASVPFGFDVHAMVYTDDAPGLERMLQSALDRYRVNRVNSRKEFFRVPIEIVKQVVEERAPDAVFVDAAEAQDYRLSLAASGALGRPPERITAEFPAAI